MNHESLHRLESESESDATNGCRITEEGEKCVNLGGWGDGLSEGAGE